MLNSYKAEFAGSILGGYGNIVIDVGTVGIFILVAKILSAVFDPVAGNMIDRSESKKGKFKSMIIYSIVLLRVMTVIIFLPMDFKGNNLL